MITGRLDLTLVNPSIIKKRIIKVYITCQIGAPGLWRPAGGGVSKSRRADQRSRPPLAGRALRPPGFGPCGSRGFPPVISTVGCEDTVAASGGKARGTFRI